MAISEPLEITTDGALIKQAVRDLSLSAWQRYADRLPVLPAAWLATVKQNGKQVALAESSGKVLTGHLALTGAILISRHIERLSPQHNIGLLLPPSVGGALANMAVLLRGKTAVNLNYTAPLAAVMAAIDRADIRDVYTSRLFMSRLKQRGMDLDGLSEKVQLHFLEDVAAQASTFSKLVTLGSIKVMPAGVLRWLYTRRAAPSDTAVILFSSGSEGMPKGVELTHRNVMANIKQVSYVLDIRDDDVMVMNLPLFHAFGLTVNCFLPLIEGFPSAAHPDATDAVGLGQTTARYKGTILCATSTLFRLYNRSLKLHPLMFESLRLVVAGAEKLSPMVHDRFKEKFGKSILEGYGATETAPVASVNVPDVLDTVFWRVQTGDRPGSVGMPLPGTNFRVTDPETLEELPIGEGGMVFIGGPQVMKGYLGDPEKTEDVLFEVDGTVWYKTGDKGHLDRDGFLTLTDRFSRFAKIGGEMVSLGAVEEQVRQVVGDGDVDLVAINAPDGRKGEKVVLLVAEVHADVAENLKEKLLEANTGAQLIPADIRIIPEVPKLGSGKTDFKTAKELFTTAEGG